MNVSELLGKPVLDLSTATTVGRIDDVVLDVPGRRLHGLRVGKSTGAGEWLAWDDIKAVGSDAVTIDAVDRVGAIPAELPGCWLRGDKALGGRVLSDGGRELGSLTDIDLDASRAPSSRWCSATVGSKPTRCRASAPTPPSCVIPPTADVARRRGRQRWQDSAAFVIASR